MAESIRNQIVKAHAVLDALSTEHWSRAEDLGQLIGVGRKAIKTYTDALRDMGYPVESTPGKGHRLSAEVDGRQLLLCAEELTLLFLALSRSSADFPEDALQRTKRRLLNSLSQHKREKALKLDLSPDQSKEPFFQDFTVLETLQNQFGTNKVIRLRYQGLKDAEPAMRRVLALEFAPRNRWWYLVAWDLDRKDERHFRIDRILDAVVLPETAKLPDKADKHTMHPWDFGEENIEIRILVTPQLGQWIIESPVHPSQQLEANGDGHFIATFEVRCAGKFVDWLMGLRGFQLLGPEPLKDALKTRAKILFESQGSLNVPWEVGGG